MGHRLSRPIAQMNMFGLTSPKISHRASAVVTGARSGIGAAFAVELARRDSAVVSRPPLLPAQTRRNTPATSPEPRLQY